MLMGSVGRTEVFTSVSAGRASLSRRHASAASAEMRIFRPIRMILGASPRRSNSQKVVLLTLCDSQNSCRVKVKIMFALIRTNKIVSHSKGNAGQENTALRRKFHRMETADYRLRTAECVLD